MDQKLFEQRISEVAEWHRERHQGNTSNSKAYAAADQAPIPTYIKIDRFKPKTCPYQTEKTNCFWKIHTAKYKGCKPVKVTKCQTCGALLTPKGNFIPKPAHHNYPKIIRESDEDE